MNRQAQLIGVSARRTFLEWMTWRGFLVTIVLGQCVTPVLGLAVWSAALPDAGNVSAYYVAILLVQVMTVTQEEHTTSNRIYEGTLSHDLLKPQPPIIGTIGTALASRLWHVIIGLPVVVLVWLATGATFSPVSVALAIPALLLAAMVRFLFVYTLALSAFWTQQAHGAVGFGETLIFLLGGLPAPVALMPERFRDVGEILPFRAMLGLPAEIATGSLSRQEVLIGIALQSGWLLVFAALAAAVWQRGLRRFTAIGG